MSQIIDNEHIHFKLLDDTLELSGKGNSGSFEYLVPIKKINEVNIGTNFYELKKGELPSEVLADINMQKGVNIFFGAISSVFLLFGLLVLIGTESMFGLLLILLGGYGVFDQIEKKNQKIEKIKGEFFKENSYIDINIKTNEENIEQRIKPPNSILDVYEKLDSVIEEVKNRKEILLQKQESNLNKQKQQLKEVYDVTESGKIEIPSPSSFKKIIDEYREDINQLDDDYVRNLVKVSRYLEQKHENIQLSYNKLHEEDHLISFEKNKKYLETLLYTYNSVLFHSISLVFSLLSNKKIVFYEIYEAFDELGIFRSKFESDLTSQLQNMDEKLSEILIQNEVMEHRITKSLNNLTYINSLGFKELIKVTDEKLSKIDTQLTINNLLTSINTYKSLKNK